LLISAKRALRTEQELDKLRERTHRLEIQLSEVVDLITTLQTSHGRLQSTVRGRLGGRPRHDEVRLGGAAGDKAARRAQLASLGLLNARYHQQAAMPPPEGDE